MRKHGEFYQTDANLQVAQKENSSILLEDSYTNNYDGFNPNSSEAYIIFSLYQNAYLDKSLDFAAMVQKQAKNKAGMIDRGVRQAGFLVLWKTTMPSVLVESGFLTNEKDEDFLASATGQDNIAGSVFKAFKEYKNEMEGNTSKTKDFTINKEPISNQANIKDSTNYKKDTTKKKQ